MVGIRKNLLASGQGISQLHLDDGEGMHQFWTDAVKSLLHGDNFKSVLNLRGELHDVDPSIAPQIFRSGSSLRWFRTLLAPFNLAFDMRYRSVQNDPARFKDFLTKNSEDEDAELKLERHPMMLFLSFFRCGTHMRILVS